MTRLPIILALILLAACAAPAPTTTPTETPVPEFPTAEGRYLDRVAGPGQDLILPDNILGFPVPDGITTFLVGEVGNEMALAKRVGKSLTFPIGGSENGLAVFGDGTWPMEIRGEGVVFTDPATGEVWQQVLTAEVPDGVTGVSGMDQEGNLWLLFWNDQGEFMGKLPGLVAPVEGMNPVARVTETGQMQILTWPIEGQAGQYALSWNETTKSWQLTPEGAVLYEQRMTEEMYALVVNPESGRVEKQLEQGYLVFADRQTGANVWEQTETGEWVWYVPRVRISWELYFEHFYGEVGEMLTAELIVPPDFEGGTGLTRGGAILKWGPELDSLEVSSDESKLIAVYGWVGDGSVSFFDERYGATGTDFVEMPMWFPLRNGDNQLALITIPVVVGSEAQLWGYPGGDVGGTASYSRLDYTTLAEIVQNGGLAGGVWGIRIRYDSGNNPGSEDYFARLTAVMEAWMAGSPSGLADPVGLSFNGLLGDEAAVRALVGE